MWFIQSSSIDVRLSNDKSNGAPGIFFGKHLKQKQNDHDQRQTIVQSIVPNTHAIKKKKKKKNMYEYKYEISK